LQQIKVGILKYDKLLEPLNIGKVRAKNRIIKTASGTFFADEYNVMGENRTAFYESMARGGSGLIIVEPCPVEFPRGAYQPDLIRIDDDRFLPGLEKLAKVIHNYDCPAFLQLVHSGPWGLVPSASPEWDPPWPSGMQRITVSSLAGIDLPEPWFDATSRELTIADIEGLVDSFAVAAQRAQQVGFDGVEVNAGTCHLVNSFFSRVWNRRQDAYGCDCLENRGRFAVGIIKEIKKRLGSDFPVSTLINGSEFGIKKGTTIEEARSFARMLEDAGADAIHVRAYGYGDYMQVDSPEHVYFPEPPEHLAKELDWRYKGNGLLSPLAASIKQVVSVPVITVGRLGPEIGEKILQEGKADFIGITRRLFADPELPNKVASGRLEDIAPCRACLECSPMLQLRCGVNAALGGDIEYYSIKQAEKRKKVLVIGGGPAGMEASRVAAIRGHEVILYEKEPKLGGLLPLVEMVKGPDVEDIAALLHYQTTQLKKLGMETRLGKEFDPSLIREIDPDVVIIATGGLPAMPEIPGIDGTNVIKAADLHARLKFLLNLVGPRILRRLTSLWMPLGKRVAIIGGAIHGCELAEFLVKRGRLVTVVDTSETLGEGLPTLSKARLIRWLEKKGVTMLGGIQYDKITDRGISVIHRDGQKQMIEADTMVTAIPFIPNTRFRTALEGEVPEIYSAGDCSDPRLIVDAIADGYRIAREI